MEFYGFLLRVLAGLDRFPRLLLAGASRVICNITPWSSFLHV